MYGALIYLFIFYSEHKRCVEGEYVERYCEDSWNSQVLNKNAIVVCKRLHLLPEEVVANVAIE